MRLVRTAALVLLCIATAACGNAGITGSDPAHRMERSMAGTIDPEAAAPRMNGGFAGSGT
jgi:predicted outer membrane protein